MINSDRRIYPNSDKPKASAINNETSIPALASVLSWGSASSSAVLPSAALDCCRTAAAAFFPSSVLQLVPVS